MIEVKPTILETIKDKIRKMRFLGQNDQKSLKAVLSLIIIDDLFDWSSYLEDSQAVLNMLKELRTNYIQCNPTFLRQYKTTFYRIDPLTHEQSQFEFSDPITNAYVNVNTPQNDNTWKRVWDSKKIQRLDGNKIIPIVPETPAEPFEPDPTCPVSIVYFGSGEIIPATESGTPDVDINKLSICEKMNIYINRDTGKPFYLDPKTCVWKPLVMGTEGNIAWSQIKDAPTIYQGIEHFINEDGDTLTVNLLSDGEPTSDITVMKASEIDDVL